MEKSRRGRSLTSWGKPEFQFLYYKCSTCHVKDLLSAYTNQAPRCPFCNNSMGSIWHLNYPSKKKNDEQAFLEERLV